MVKSRPDKTCESQRHCIAWPLTIAISFCFTAELSAQSCPPNLDFEKGTFDGWTTYSGTTGHSGGVNQISLFASSPETGRHTVYKRSANPELDPYGGFPVVCPNGSGYSIKLGNDRGGTEAEGVSYQFTIPSNRNEYSLIYHYAVVFQDPSHLPFEQPRMETEIINVSDNNIISCSSFTFYPVGSPLPGFFESPNPGSGTPVWCKNWTAVSVNLDGLAGKTIRLFFKTADCTFRRHFGYAYIDVNSECTGEFTGATFCRGDSAVQVEAPHGYQRYTWFTADFDRVVGDQQSLTLMPAPPAGTRLAVEVIPYDGYGCPDTLYANLIDTLTIRSLAGGDKNICHGIPEEIGFPPKPGIHYSWIPTDGLSSSTISNPYANPQATTQYVLTSRSFGGGCVERDTVVVKSVYMDNTLELIGKNQFCKGYGDSAVLRLAGDGAVQWFRDGAAINAATGYSYQVLQSGAYHAQLFKEGCTASTDVQKIIIEAPRPGVRYPMLYLVANNPVTLEARDFGQTVQWQPATFLNSPTAVKPVFDGSADLQYTITITTAAGCIAVDTQAVTIVKQVDIMVPNAFTPNGDGRNDVLRPFLFGIRELVYFRVYNRWGQLLFETRKPHTGWNGRSGGALKGNEVVVWVAEGIGMDGKRHLRKGTTVCIQ